MDNSQEAVPRFLTLPGGRRLAYRLREGTTPGIAFLHGFRSDMEGAKATAVDHFCRNRGIRCLRFDYSGHGQSSGDFLQGTIGGWKQDVLDMLEHIGGRHVLVGSSLGAWLALLVAREWPQLAAGLVGVASAPDFTEAIIRPQLSAEQEQQLETKGILYVPDCTGGEPFPITSALLEEGRRHLLLDGTIRLDMPVRLLHGTEDKDVPWRMALQLMERIVAPNLSLTLIKGGGHRLSEPGQIETIIRAVEEILGKVF